MYFYTFVKINQNNLNRLIELSYKLSLWRNLVNAFKSAMNFICICGLSTKIKCLPFISPILGAPTPLKHSINNCWSIQSAAKLHTKTWDLRYFKDMCNDNTSMSKNFHMDVCSHLSLFTRNLYWNVELTRINMSYGFANITSFNNVALHPMSYCIVFNACCFLDFLPLFRISPLIIKIVQFQLK